MLKCHLLTTPPESNSHSQKADKTQEKATILL